MSHDKLVHIVNHVFNTWDDALGRWIYFRKLGQSLELVKALTPSYAAHVHNALQNALIYDSIREIGALILDENGQSASLYRVVRLINGEGVLEAIRKQYEVVPPVSHANEDLPKALLDEIAAELQQERLKEQLQEFDNLHTQVKAIGANVFEGDIAGKLKRTRKKAVAHYDVQNTGTEWKTVSIGDAGLNYGDMEAYLVKCTDAVACVTKFVQRKGMNFDASREIYERRVVEYIDALVRGRQSQEAEKVSRRAS